MKPLTALAVLLSLALSAPALAKTSTSTIQERDAERERQYLETFGVEGGLSNPHNQYRAGKSYCEGTRVTQDIKKCVSFLKSATELGDSDAQVYLGFKYLLGKDVPLNRDEASRLFKLSAAHGDVYAQTEIGNSYLNGYGVTQDYLKAYMWLSVSAVPSNRNAPAAIKSMEVIKAKISAAELARAIEMARACAESKFEKCD